MRCPNRATPEHDDSDDDYIMRKARGDIYWCEVCGAHLIKHLKYTTFAKAAKVGDGRELFKK